MKAASLLFDDEEEEVIIAAILIIAMSEYNTSNRFLALQDLFATAVKSNTKSNQASTLQPTKAVSTSLFSDDEVKKQSNVSFCSTKG